MYNEMQQTGYANAPVTRPQPESPGIQAHMESACQRLSDINAVANTLCERIGCSMPPSDVMGKPMQNGLLGQVEAMHGWLTEIHSKLVGINNAL